MNRWRRIRLKDAARTEAGAYRCDCWWVAWVARARRQITARRQAQVRHAVQAVFAAAYELAKG